jgi:hypothetical protein
MRSALTTFMAVLATATTATLGQVLPPTEGYQLGGPLNLSDPGGPSIDTIMPLMVAQCDPVLIYSNTTATNSFWNISSSHGYYMDLFDPLGYIAATIELPSNDVGYFEWICNIPAGEAFLVFG